LAFAGSALAAAAVVGRRAKDQAAAQSGPEGEDA
ncbi:RpiR family transcriptional regulator, partial [Streptomyces sp. FT05W]